MQLVIDTQKLIEKMQLFDKRSSQWIYFNLWPRQVEFLDILHNNLKVIICKKRQTGMSQLTGADSLAQCMIQEQFTVLVLSKTGPDAKEYLRRVSGMFNSLPEQVKELSPIEKDGVEEMVFENGSRIKSMCASSGAGYTADRVIIDEAAKITKKVTKITLEEVLTNVEPTVDKAKGQLILISTAWGRNTFWFYFYQAKKKLSSFAAFFFSCWDDPTFKPADREQIEKDHGKDHVNQEYPENDRQAFLSSGRPRFNKDSMQAYEKNALIPIWTGILQDDSDELLEDENGNFQIFQSIEPRTQYMVVADISEGIENELKDPDYSHVKVFKISTAQQVAAYHVRRDPAVIGTSMCRLGRWWNNALLVVERNNHGIGTLVQIRNVELYPEILIFEHDLILKEKRDSDYKKPVPRLGWLTSKTTRPIIIDNFANMVREKSIPALAADDVEEGYSFEIIKGKAQANESSHDDRILCLCIAYYLLTLDAFYVHYPLLKPKSHECCANCKYSIIEEGATNICQQTKKNFLKSNDWCVMWEEFLYSNDEFAHINHTTGEEEYNDFIPM